MAEPTPRPLGERLVARCAARTATGRRCRNWVAFHAEIPADPRKGTPLYCHHHRPEADMLKANAEAIERELTDPTLRIFPRPEDRAPMFGSSDDDGM